ncbi:hypothetical protein CVT25_004974 [Psilocybe cyanescens]|uniref:Uncharacterized protein n=1 Tax=Psilocybe cyanescens TaxID=93625 RepID=A0A409W3Y5_PSICY|nr:hypothetical protein CVT25_004974 [Psilocybe cyanescens]
MQFCKKEVKGQWSVVRKKWADEWAWEEWEAQVQVVGFGLEGQSSGLDSGRYKRRKKTTAVAGIGSGSGGASKGEGDGEVSVEC